MRVIHRVLYFSTEAATKHPLVEKYQFIKTDFNNNIIEIVWLVLGLVGLVLVWIYIFYGGKKNKLLLHTDLPIYQKKQ